MITRIILLVLLCLSNSSWLAAEMTMKMSGPKEIIFLRDGKEVAKQTLDDKLKVKKTEGTVPDGVIKVYYPSGKLAAEATYKEARKNGLLKAYYENGKLREETYFKNELQEGRSKTYYDDGKLAQDVNYQSGKLAGVCKSFFKNGKLKQEAAYVNGNPEGPAKKYFDDGQLQEDMIYHSGKVVKSKLYNIKGELIYEKGTAVEQQQ